MSEELVTYTLKLKEKPIVPIEARALKPDKFAGKPIDDIRKLKVLEGNRRVVLEELFDIDGPSTGPKEPQNIEIIITGEGTGKVRYLGYKMTAGKIVVKGDIGPLAGFKMRDGTIIVEGNARSWLGAKMRKGTIEVFGNAGDFVGAKLQGERPGRGMKGGMIIIHGNAGSNIGAGMKGGAIIVEGNAGNLIGTYMTGGSIAVEGNAGSFIGARMSGGKIVVVKKVDGILPSFYVDSIVKSAKVKGRRYEKSFMLFMGDVIVNGRGSLFIAYEENESLLEPYKNIIAGVEL